MRNQSKKSSAGRNRDGWEHRWATLQKVAQIPIYLRPDWMYYPYLYRVKPSPFSTAPPMTAVSFPNWQQTECSSMIKGDLSYLKRNKSYILRPEESVLMIFVWPSYTFAIRNEWTTIHKTIQNENYCLSTYIFKKQTRRCRIESSLLSSERRRHWPQVQNRPSCQPGLLG